MSPSFPPHDPKKVPGLDTSGNEILLNVERLTHLFNQGVERAKADEHISHREVRELGRELGVTLARELAPILAQPTLRHLIATCADLIGKSNLTPEHQASCWSNLRKGFIGETETFELGQARSALVDGVETELPHLREMFYRYPNPANVGALTAFHSLRDAIDQRFPNLSQQSAHESALIMYGMGLPREEASQETQARYTRQATRILALCEAYVTDHPNVSLASLLRPLSRVASIYDKASQRIAEGQRAQATFNERHHRITNRFDLFDRVSRPEQLAALISPAVITAASSLVSRGSYIGRLYLDTIVDFPRHHAILHHSCPQTRYLLESRYKSLISAPSSGPPTQAVAIGTRGLREFTATSYINIGLECLNQSPNAPRFHSDSSRDVALLSEFIFEKVAALEFERLSDIHGPPSSRHGFLGGGANARREYPSFDYDWFLVYEHEGQTVSCENQSPISNHEFFTRLSRAVDTTLSYLGANSDGAYVPHHPVSLQPERAVTKERYQYLLDSAPDPHMELRLRVNMIPLGGDRSLCAEWLTHISSLVQSASAEIMQNQTKVILSFARAKLSSEHINIKTTPGGLRMGTHLWIACAVAYDRTFDSFEEVTDLLRADKLISEDSAASLTSSYHYLLRLRVRLDMQYGRNEKSLPTGDELTALSKSLGFVSSRNSTPPESLLKAETLHVMRELRAIIGGTYSDDGDVLRPGVIHFLRERLLTTRGIDIFDDSVIRVAEERSKQARLDYAWLQAARTENRWIDAMSEPSLE
jgi:hypothetical protein